MSDNEIRIDESADDIDHQDTNVGSVKLNDDEIMQNVHSSDEQTSCCNPESEMAEKSNELEVSDEDVLSSVPKFGHQLVILPCADLNHWFRIELNFKQKCIAFAVMFVQGVLLALVTLVFLFGADFAFDYAHRGQEFVAFFGKFFFLAAAFAAVCVFAVQVMRNTPIFINPVQKRIVNARKLTENLASQSLELKDIESVKVDCQNGMLKRSSFIVSINEQNIALMDSFGDCDDLLSLSEWINTIRADAVE